MVETHMLHFHLNTTDADLSTENESKQSVYDNLMPFDSHMLCSGEHRFQAQTYWRTV